MLHRHCIGRIVFASALLSGGIALASFGSSQVRQPGGAPRLASDIPLSRAMRSVGDFYDAIGLTRPDPSKAKWLILSKLGGRRYLIRPGDDRQIWVSTSTGKVVMFQDTKRDREQLSNSYRPLALFAKESTARSHLLALAKKLGVPSDAKLINWTHRLDGQGGDHNKAGLFGGVFWKEGYSCSISCDVMDGRVTFFSLMDKTSP